MRRHRDATDACPVVELLTSSNLSTGESYYSEDVFPGFTLAQFEDIMMTASHLGITSQ